MQYKKNTFEDKIKNTLKNTFIQENTYSKIKIFKNIDNIKIEDAFKQTIYQKIKK